MSNSQASSQIQKTAGGANDDAILKKEGVDSEVERAAPIDDHNIETTTAPSLDASEPEMKATTMNDLRK